MKRCDFNEVLSNASTPKATSLRIGSVTKPPSRHKISGARVSRVHYVRNGNLDYRHIWLQTEITVQCTLHEIWEIQDHDSCSSSVRLLFTAEQLIKGVKGMVRVSRGCNRLFSERHGHRGQSRSLVRREGYEANCPNQDTESQRYRKA